LELKRQGSSVTDRRGPLGARCFDGRAFEIAGTFAEAEVIRAISLNTSF
jgi:hypothetical protein